MLQSFISVSPDSHFPIQNLPYGIFTPPEGGPPRVGVRIGDWVLDTAVLQHQGFFNGPHLQDHAIFDQPTLNPFMALGKPAWQEARATLTHLLNAHTPTLRDDPHLQAQLLHPIADVTLHLPAQIGDFTDFYAAKEHAANVGRIFRDPQNPLLPNWQHIPIAYHGRSSSIVLSGHPITRPHGQIMSPGAAAPHMAPTAELDFELEVGFFTGPGNALGQPIPITAVQDHIFGLVLVNDWSARDMQRWEYRPLGPFLAKNFATSISPWVVTLDALAPFHCPAPPQDPTPLTYLQHPQRHSYNIQLQVNLQPANSNEAYPICQTNFHHLYWSLPQMLAHHTSNGCNIRPGDLFATGAISGPTPNSYGSMLELAWHGARPLSLPNGETRTFLADGDTITLTGWCAGDGFQVGFGAVSGTIQTVSSQPNP